MKKIAFIILLINCFGCNCNSQIANVNSSKQNSKTKQFFDKKQIKPIETGASQTHNYVPKLRNKKIGLLVNQTAQINGVLLVDTLKKLGLNITTIFGPEHGFRGNADAGEKVGNYTDEKTGIPVISLYGAKDAPTTNDLKNIDVLVFDIQDVGTRFYTYTITLFKVMQACADANLDLIILDRPNPNAHLIDGPVLNMAFKSGVGANPIPIAHGLTIAEFALMVNGQKWLKNGVQCKLEIIKNNNYNHWLPYNLPVKPSPNLPNNLSVYLYPTLCLFEGTSLSMGRGTLFPFQVLGHPLLNNTYNFTFTPISIVGMSKNPPLINQKCYGIDFSKTKLETLKNRKIIDLALLLKIYNQYPDKENFFNSFFNKLAGNATLMQQIKSGKSEVEIRATWQPQLKAYKAMRKNYLLYP